MKITSIVTLPMAAPYLCDIGASYSAKEKIGGLAVLLRTDEGVVGENLLIAVNGKGLSLLTHMARSLEPLILGRDPLSAGAFFEEARAETRHLGPSGVSLMGIGAIDGALLDLRAKIAGLPLHHFLGAARERVPAYYSGALWPGVGIDELQMTARRIVERGYWGLKLRVGVGSIAAQVDRVKAIRDAVGPDVKVLLDVNQRLDERRALQLGRAIEPFDIHWLEEPVDGRDHAAEARISAALDTPISAGESAFSLDECRDMIERRCVDVLMPDLQRIGGPSEFMRIGQLASAARMPVSGHTLSEMTLSLMASLPNACCLEVMPWSAPFYADKIRISEGFAHASAKPGWGLALDPARLREYALEAADI